MAIKENMDVERGQGSGLYEAAKLLVSLGGDAATLITKHLEPEELELLTSEIHALGSITPQEKKTVIKKFYDTATDREFIAQGGEDMALQLLSSNLGERRAKAMLDRFKDGGKSDYFSMINEVDAPTVANFLKSEHPQTIALVLASLPSSQSGQILLNLPEDLRTSISYRIATIERPSSEVIGEVQSVLGEYVSSDFQEINVQFGGTNHVAETFNEIDQSVWRGILEEIGDMDPEVAEAIKNLMFTFADLILLDNKSVQNLLKEIDSKDLTLALKGASEEVQDLITRNMSKRAGKVVAEEMEYLGAVRVSEVETAQQRIIDTVRDLEMEGHVYIAGRGGEESAFIE